MMTKRGFTLLEMIIVIIMTVALTGAVFFVYLVCFRTWNAGQDRLNLRNGLYQALEGITNDLHNSTAIARESDNSLYFALGSTGYRFYLYSPQDPDPPAYSGTDYSLLRSTSVQAYGVGSVVATGIQPHVFSVVGSLVTVDLTATRNGSTVHMRTKVRSRNF